MSQLRVLVIDDQAIILAAVQQMLAFEADFELRLESQSADALQSALAFKPNVVLLDLVMEPLNGLGVLALLRAQIELADVPVVMLSAEENPAIKVSAFKAGANDYLVKLPDPAELIARVRYHAKAHVAYIERAAAFQALLESQAALHARNAEVEAQKRLLEQRNRELEEAAVTDALTGLRNRRYLKRFLASIEEIPLIPSNVPQERRRYLVGNLSVFLFDLDFFKRVNDQYGHEAGDAVLVHVGQRLRETVREDDAIMRWGGEEFLVIGRGHSREGTMVFAERLLHAIGDSPVMISDKRELRVTCSMGFTYLEREPVGGLSDWHHQAINVADLAAYRSKQSGRNRATGVFSKPGQDDLGSIQQLMSEPGDLTLMAKGKFDLVEVQGH